MNSLSKTNKGNLASYKFDVKVKELNLGSIGWMEEGCIVDTILIVNNNPIKLQIKSSAHKAKGRTDEFKFCIKTNHGSYKKSEVDYICCYIHNLDIWYIIPTEKIESIKGLALYPTKDNGGKYEKYKEAWHLLNDTNNSK